MLCIVERLWHLLAFINRVIGRNVLGHGLTMSWLFVAFEESMYGVLSYYLNYVVQFADCSTDRIFCMSHYDLDIWHTKLEIHRVNAEGIYLYTSKVLQTLVEK